MEVKDSVAGVDRARTGVSTVFARTVGPFSSPERHDSVLCANENGGRGGGDAQGCFDDKETNLIAVKLDGSDLSETVRYPTEVDGGERQPEGAPRPTSARQEEEEQVEKEHPCGVCKACRPPAVGARLSERIAKLLAAQSANAVSQSPPPPPPSCVLQPAHRRRSEYGAQLALMGSALLPLPTEPDDDPKRVEVYWPGFNAYYSGLIMGHRANSGEHRIEYDDGDDVWHKLWNEIVRKPVQSEEDYQELTVRSEDEGDEDTLSDQSMGDAEEEGGGGYGSDDGDGSMDYHAGTATPLGEHEHSIRYEPHPPRRSSKLGDSCAKSNTTHGYSGCTATN